MIAIDGLRVVRPAGRQVASLRYFDPDGAFAAAVRECTGHRVPGPLEALAFGPAPQEGAAVLAWRSPTEALLACSDGGIFAKVRQRLAAAADGCLVDQTGGITIVEVDGRLSVDLLQRMGAPSCIPALGEARAGRLAEVRVLTASIRAGEYLMFVERVYAAHMIEWMRISAADLR